MMIRKIVYEILPQETYCPYTKCIATVYLENGKVVQSREMFPTDHFTSIFDHIMNSIKQKVKRAIENDDRFRG